MCLSFLANKLSNCRLTVERINSNMYYKAVQEGWMTTGCFINSPDAIVNELMKPLPIRVQYTGVHEPPGYVCGPREYEVLRWERGKDWGHFVVGDGSGHVAYDPMGLSETVAQGRLVSKRIFRLT